MKKTFKTNFIDGSENVMKIEGYVSEIRYDINTRNITIIQESDTYTNEDLDHLSWWALKRLITEHGGEWTNTKEAISFLIGKEKK